MTTLYASIGNSDNKLTQQRWALFVHQFRDLVGRVATEIYGDWISESSSSYQNACMAFDVADPMIVQGALGLLAEQFDQDCIAVAHVERTVFVTSVIMGGEQV